MGYNPNIVITESTIGKYNLFTNSKFASLLLSQLNYPIIIVRGFYYVIGQFCEHLMLKITGNPDPASACAFDEKQGKIDVYMDLVIYHV